MKLKYAFIFICAITLAIIGMEFFVLLRGSDKPNERQTPELTPSTLDNSGTTPGSFVTVANLLQSLRTSAKGNDPSSGEEQEDKQDKRGSDKPNERQTPELTPSTLDNSGTTPGSFVTVANLLQSLRTSAKGNDPSSGEEQEDKQDKRHVVLMAARRTGSSFVGEFFNHQTKNTFYLYEPLWHAPIDRDVYRHVLQRLFLCDFSPLEKYITPRPKDHITSDFFHRESSLSLCEEPACSPVSNNKASQCLNRRCGPLNITRASESCLSKKNHVIKTIRVNDWGILKTLLEDPRLNLRVIQLVRDPRPMIASWFVAFGEKYQGMKAFKKGGHLWREEVTRLKGSCDAIRMTAEVGLSQPDWLKNRYMLVRYEDIALDPIQKAEEMFKFTGIPFSPQAREWILKNTQTNGRGIYSTQRKSSEQVDKWRMTFPFALVQVIQRVCNSSMKLFGYTLVEDETELKNKSISLLEERHFV